MQQKNTTPSGSGASPPRKRSYVFYNVISWLMLTLLPASGMVSIGDIGFAIFSFIYIYFISKVVFPFTRHHGSVINPTSKAFVYYYRLSAVIGLLLPILYASIGTFQGYKDAIKVVAPHLFSMACQGIMEGFTVRGNFSIPIRVFVPVLHNAKRVSVLAGWLKYQGAKINEEHGGFHKWVVAGMIIAAANMAMWCFNLFCFLLPVYLPKAFEKYYSSLASED